MPNVGRPQGKHRWVVEFEGMTPYSFPGDITVGPDDNLWATGGPLEDIRMKRITPAGEITEFPVGNAEARIFPHVVTTGPTEISGSSMGLRARATPWDGKPCERCGEVGWVPPPGGLIAASAHGEPAAEVRVPFHLRPISVPWDDSAGLPHVQFAGRAVCGG